jgi:thiol-disulfide isomerase/thioredoxin
MRRMVTGTDGDDRRRLRPSMYAAVAVASTLVGFGGVYAISRMGDRPTDRPDSGRSIPGPRVVGTAGATGAANPLAVGEMTAFVFRSTPEPLPPFTFTDAAGQPRSLADFNGKVVLLNLWATWCAPCRKEMPGLDRLQGAQGGPTFEVVALSVDRQGAPVAQKFLTDIGVRHLHLYVDSGARSLSTWGITGLPTTILIGRDGREIGRLAGPAEWDTPDAMRLVEAARR